MHLECTKYVPKLISLKAIRSHGIIETPTKHDMVATSCDKHLVRDCEAQFQGKNVVSTNKSLVQVFISSNMPRLNSAPDPPYSICFPCDSTATQWPRSTTRTQALSYRLRDLHPHPQH
jgi:hypothetical protein